MYTKLLKGDLVSFYGMPGIYQNLENRWFSMEPVLKIEGIYLYMGPAPLVCTMESSGVVRTSGQPQHPHR